VNDDFASLFRFFDARRAEVHGRSATRVTPDLREGIRRFAAGTSAEQERAEIKQLLQQQPELIPLLVEAVEALRQEEK
jgi:hypothetical protein